MSSIPKILIEYPEEFNCYSKFERKVRTILSHMKIYELLYLHDKRGFIAKFISTASSKCNARKVSGTLEYINVITHAIIFDDHESFNGQLDFLKHQQIVLRMIETPITRVVNKKDCKDYDVYIGRGSGWGNPYAIGSDGERDEVISKFKYDFDGGFLGEDDFKEKLLQLRGKRIACHCAPLPCHGDVYADYLNSYDDQK